ncbi:unnamed protein product [Amoebophrya sp. A120]|nr:unnamed protein product [Amoebophrya sp. A120]|eukprot:GSA120T00008374001.1
MTTRYSASCSRIAVGGKKMLHFLCLSKAFSLLAFLLVCYDVRSDHSSFVFATGTTTGSGGETSRAASASSELTASTAPGSLPTRAAGFAHETKGAGISRVDVEKGRRGLLRRRRRSPYGRTKIDETVDLDEQKSEKEHQGSINQGRAIPAEIEVEENHDLPQKSTTVLDRSGIHDEDRVEAQEEAATSFQQNTKMKLGVFLEQRASTRHKFLRSTTRTTTAATPVGNGGKNKTQQNEKNSKAKALDDVLRKKNKKGNRKKKKTKQIRPLLPEDWLRKTPDQVGQDLFHLGVSSNDQRIVVQDQHRTTSDARREERQRPAREENKNIPSIISSSDTISYAPDVVDVGLFFPHRTKSKWEKSSSKNHLYLNLENVDEPYVRLARTDHLRGGEAGEVVEFENDSAAVDEAGTTSSSTRPALPTASSGSSVRAPPPRPNMPVPSHRQEISGTSTTSGRGLLLGGGASTSDTTSTSIGTKTSSSGTTSTSSTSSSRSSRDAQRIPSSPSLPLKWAERPMRREGNQPGIDWSTALVDASLVYRGQEPGAVLVDYDYQYRGGALEHRRGLWNIKEGQDSQKSDEEGPLRGREDGPQFEKKNPSTTTRLPPAQEYNRPSFKQALKWGILRQTTTTTRPPKLHRTIPELYPPDQHGQSDGQRFGPWNEQQMEFQFSSRATSNETTANATSPAAGKIRWMSRKVLSSADGAPAGTTTSASGEVAGPTSEEKNASIEVVHLVIGAGGTNVTNLSSDAPKLLSQAGAAAAALIGGDEFEECGSLSPLLCNVLMAVLGFALLVTVLVFVVHSCCVEDEDESPYLQSASGAGGRGGHRENHRSRIIAGGGVLEAMNYYDPANPNGYYSRTPRETTGRGSVLAGGGSNASDVEEKQVDDHSISGSDDASSGTSGGFDLKKLHKQPTEENAMPADTTSTTNENISEEMLTSQLQNTNLLGGASARRHGRERRREKKAVAKQSLEKRAMGGEPEQRVGTDEDAGEVIETSQQPRHSTWSKIFRQ